MDTMPALPGRSPRRRVLRLQSGFQAFSADKGEAAGQLFFQGAHAPWNWNFKMDQTMKGEDKKMPRWAKKEAAGDIQTEEVQDKQVKQVEQHKGTISEALAELRNHKRQIEEAIASLERL